MNEKCIACANNYRVDSNTLFCWDCQRKSQELLQALGSHMTQSIDWLIKTAIKQVDKDLPLWRELVHQAMDAKLSAMMLYERWSMLQDVLRVTTERKP